jgi:hypothetical protein
VGGGTLPCLSVFVAFFRLSSSSSGKDGVLRDRQTRVHPPRQLQGHVCTVRERVSVRSPLTGRTKMKGRRNFLAFKTHAAINGFMPSGAKEDFIVSLNTNKSSALPPPRQPVHQRGSGKRRQPPETSSTLCRRRWSRVDCARARVPRHETGHELQYAQSTDPFKYVREPRSIRAVLAVPSQERAHPGPSTAIDGRHLLEGVALTEDILKGVVLAIIGAFEGLFDLATLRSAVSSLRELGKVARCLAAHTLATHLQHMSNTLATHCTCLAAHSLQRLLFLRPLDDEVPAVQVRGLERVLGGNGLLVLPHVSQKSVCCCCHVSSPDLKASALAHFLYKTTI